MQVGTLLVPLVDEGPGSNAYLFAVRAAAARGGLRGDWAAVTGQRLQEGR